MTEVSARRAATRDRLVDAAVVVFAEKGVLGAAVEEICEAAGFTRGAFYSNFTNKDDLCVAMLERHSAMQMAALDEALATLDTGGGTDATGDLDALIATALGVFFAAQPAGRHWVLAGQELRLHAARSPEFAAEYWRFSQQATCRVAEVVEGAIGALGYRLATSGTEAIGALHAVYDYGTVGALIGAPESVSRASVLLTEVLRAFIRRDAPDGV